MFYVKRSVGVRYGLSSYDDMRDHGFTLVEIMVVLAIIGVLAAIAIPITLTQQARATNTSIKSDMTAVATTIENSLLVWRGKPEAAMNVCATAATFPSSPAPANTCTDGAWTLKTVSGNANPTTGAVGGKLTSGVFIQGRVAVDGSYCLDGSASRLGTSSYRFISTKSQVEDGTCQQAGWTSASTAQGTAASTATSSAAAPANVSVAPDNTAKTATVQWTATSGVTYSVKISGQAAKTMTAATTGTVTCIFPAATCAGPASGTLTSGIYTASVRAANATGYGPSSDSEFTLTGKMLSTATKVNMGSPQPAPVATVANTRMNMTTNPSIETNTTTWSSSRGTLAKSSAQAYSGTSSLQYTSSSTSEFKLFNYGNTTDRFNVTPGTSIAFSAYLRADAANSATYNWRGLLFWYDATGTVMSPSSTAVNSYTAVDSTGWTRIGGVVTVPAGAVTAFARFQSQETMTGGQVMYADAALMELSTTVDSYFDGSSLGGFWTGTANASTSVLTVSATARGRAKVSWVIPDGATGLQAITYTVTSIPDDVTCVTVGYSSCYVTGLDNDTTYTFKVEATTAAGTGSAGVSNAVTTPAAATKAATPPDKPTNLVAVPGLPGQINLTWSAPATGGITDYIIEQGANGTWAEISDGVSNTTAYTVTSLNRGLTYLYRVTSVNSSGTSPVSDTASSVPGDPPGTPVITDGPTYTPSTGAVTLTITAPASGSGITYLTTYSTSNTGVTSGNIVGGTGATQACNASTCTFTWTGFSNKIGTKYYFYVFPVQNSVAGDPAIASAATPTVTGILSSIVANTLNECPVGYPTDMGNGNCRKVTPYTYHPENQQQSVWITDPGSCYAYCGPTFPDGSPTGGHCCWGGSDNNGGLCCQPSSGHWGSVTVLVQVKDGTPSGWYDDGSQWYQDTTKLTYSTYKAVTNFTWNDSNLTTYKIGTLDIGGNASSAGVSADLGRCPGTIIYQAKGIGGTTSSSFAMPCN